MADFNDFLARNDLEPTPANTFLARVLADHLSVMLFSDGVAVPNDEEEMNWRLFFAHSQDMQGFRADIFTGGWNEAKNPYAPQFAGLRDRWPDSRSMIEGLAALWNDSAAQAELKVISNPFRPQEEKAKGTRPALDLLRGPHGNAATRMFAETLSEMTGPMVARSTNRMVRAYAQNSALLMKRGGSYLGYLRSIVPDLYLPAAQIVEAERAWQQAIVRDFYNVGPALAAYLICDWLLWLWRQGQIEWFESYKEDSVFLKALAQENCLPAEAAGDFLAFCRNLRLPQEWVPRPLFHLAHYGLPPRLVNEPSNWSATALPRPPKPRPNRSARQSPWTWSTLPTRFASGKSRNRKPSA
jgi:hypothetical protein